MIITQRIWLGRLAGNGFRVDPNVLLGADESNKQAATGNNADADRSKQEAAAAIHTAAEEHDQGDGNGVNDRAGDVRAVVTEGTENGIILTAGAHHAAQGAIRHLIHGGGHTVEDVDRADVQDLACHGQIRRGEA